MTQSNVISRNSMNVYQAPVFTQHTYVLVASIKIYPLASLTISTNGRLNLATASTRPKNSSQTTASGKVGLKVLALSPLPTLSITPFPASCFEDQACLGM